MKKIVILLALILLTSCEKPKEVITDPVVTFWSDDSGPWTVYVDGKEICKLSVIYSKWANYGVPVYCGDNRFFTLSLPKGQHSYHMRYVAPPNYRVLISQSYYFEVMDCEIVRIKQKNLFFQTLCYIFDKNTYLYDEEGKNGDKRQG